MSWIEGSNFDETNWADEPSNWGEPRRGLQPTWIDYTVKNPAPYVVKRLLRDLKEVQANPLPLVSAIPYQDNLFLWHCNIKGPQNSPYEGAILHLVFLIPKDYPAAPPTVELLTPIPHDNVITWGEKTTICVDILNVGGHTRESTTVGWTPIYSIQSLLLQLQSFLFDKSQDKDPTEVRRAVEETKKFKCPQCEHRPRRPSPPFHDELKEEDFVMIKDEKEFTQDELTCFFTKQSFTETLLGVGLKPKLNARTHKLNTISASPDLISVSAFMHRNIRTDAYGSPIKYWIPLYLIDSQKDKVMHLAKKAISMVYHDNTKSFTPDLLQDFFSKLLCSILVEFLSDKTHASLKALAQFLGFHRLFLLFLTEYPQLQTAIEDRLRNFIENPNSRVKEETPSLGEILVLLSVSKKIKWNDIRHSYLEESFDRDALWVLKDYQELEGRRQVEDSERLSKWWAATAIGKRILCFQLYLMDHLDEMLKVTDQNFGRPTEKIQLQLQDEFKKSNKIDSWEEFFTTIGSPVLKEQELAAWLKRSVENSAKKGYHGSRGDVESYQAYAQGLANKLITILAENSKKDGSTFKLNDDEEVWKNYCGKTFDIFAIPANLKTESAPWKLTFIQNCVTKFLSVMHLNPDFKVFYEILDYVAQDMTDMWITWSDLPTSSKKGQEGFQKLKSGYFFLTNLLKKLFNLKTLTLVGVSGEMPLKAAQALAKGLTERASNPILTKVSFQNFIFMEESERTLFREISKFSNLEFLGVQGCYFSAGIYLGDCIGKLKKLKTLDMTCRAASMKTEPRIYIKICEGLRNNTSIEELIVSFIETSPLAIATIIKSTSNLKKFYGSGLNFRMRRMYGNETEIEPTPKENAENLSNAFISLFSQKSLNYVNLWRSAGVTGLLLPEVWEALARNNSIQTLDLAGCTFTESHGVALSDVFKMNTTITDLNLSFTNLHFILETLSMQVQQTKMPLKRLEMIGIRMEVATLGEDLGNLVGRFSQLTELDLSNVVSGYDSLPRGSQKGQKKSPIILRSTLPLAESLSRVISQTLTLTKLTLRQVSLGKLGTDPLLKSLIANRTIKVLDMSHVKADQCGKLVAELLEKNQTLEELNFFSNAVHVCASELIFAALSKNSNLKVLDLGGNLIKNRGALAAAKALQVNSTLETLKIRGNFIYNVGALAIVDAVLGNSKSALTTLHLAGNRISLDGVREVDRKVKEKSKKIEIDILEAIKIQDPERLTRVICVNAKNGRANVKDVLDLGKCGVILNVSQGPQTKQKRGTPAPYFVEFQNAISVQKALDMPKEKRLGINFSAVMESTLWRKQKPF